MIFKNVSFLFCSALLSLTNASAESVYWSEPIEVQGLAINGNQTIELGLNQTSLANPTHDGYLVASLRKLPGLLIRETSGIASSSSVLANTGLTSAATQIQIDEFPVLEASGRGIDLSLIPSALLDSVEYRSPYFQGLHFNQETNSSSGGHLILKSIDVGAANPSKLKANLMVGSASTIDGSLVIRPTQIWQPSFKPLLAVRGFNSKGNFQYHDDRQNRSVERMNNDAFHFGGLQKVQGLVGEHLQYTFINLNTLAQRTNPGSLDFPTRDHEKDQFHFQALGLHYKKWVARFSFNETQTVINSAFNTNTTESLSHYSQLGYFSELNKNYGQWYGGSAADFQYYLFNNGNNRYYQNIPALSQTLGLKNQVWNGFTKLKIQTSSLYQTTFDYSLGFTQQANANLQWGLSAQVLHQYPAMIARAGFSGGGFNVLANPNLYAEKNEMLGFHSLLTLGRLQGLNEWQITNIKNRANFVSLTPLSSQFQNADQVFLWSIKSDWHLTLLNDQLNLRGLVQLLRGWDRQSGHELAYKPRYQGLASVSYQPWVSLPLSATLEESYLAKRYIDLTTSQLVSALWQTNLRFDFKSSFGVVYFKINNLFDSAGFDMPGFPLMGRNYWLGLSLN